MALDFNKLNRVAHLATSGYGGSDSAFTLNASPATGGFTTIDSSFDGETLDYFALYSNANEFEIGKGTYTHSGVTLARSDANVSQSTNSNNRVAFSGAPIVVIDWTGRLFALLDTLLNITGDGTALGVITALDLDGRYYTETEVDTLLSNQLSSIYPVGSIVFRTSSTNPNGTLPGTWTLLSEGQFLASAGSSSGDYDLGDTGGAETVALTEGQNGPHYHTVYGDNSGGAAGTTYGIGRSSSGNHNITSASSGDGDPHENRPPFLAVNMWERTA